MGQENKLTEKISLDSILFQLIKVGKHQNSTCLGELLIPIGVCKQERAQRHGNIISLV